MPLKRIAQTAWIAALLACQGPVACAADADVLNRGNGSEPDSLHLHRAQGIGALNILRDVCEGLMSLNAAGEVVLGAAESHRRSEDGRVHTYVLRETARWSDGQPLRAEDFVRAWRLAVDPAEAVPFAVLLEAIEGAPAIRAGLANADTLGVQALDPRTLQVRLQQADPAWLQKLTLPVFCPLSAHGVDSARGGGPSNGAYRVLDWRVQSHVTLEKNPHFHAADTVHFERVVYWVTEHQSSELKRFRAGELDLTETVPDASLDWLREHLPEALRIHPYMGTFFLGLNGRDAALSNVDFRHALSLAIDRDILTEKVLRSGQAPAFHVVPPGLLPVPPSTLAGLNESERLQRAQARLKASGVRVADVELELLYNNSDNQRKVAVAVAAFWRKHLGIRTRLRNMEWKAFVSARKDPQRQAFRSGWIADYSEAMSFLELFESHSAFNFYAFNDAQYDALLQRIRGSADAQVRADLQRTAQGVLLHSLPVIPLYHYVSRRLVAPEVGGYVDNPADVHLSRYLTRRPAAARAPR